MQLTLAASRLAGRTTCVLPGFKASLHPSLFFCCGGSDLLSLAGVRPSLRPSVLRAASALREDGRLARWLACPSRAVEVT